MTGGGGGGTDGGGAYGDTTGDPGTESQLAADPIECDAGGGGMGLLGVFTIGASPLSNS